MALMCTCSTRPCRHFPQLRPSKWAAVDQWNMVMDSIPLDIKITPKRVHFEPEIIETARREVAAQRNKLLDNALEKEAVRQVNRRPRRRALGPI